LFFHEKVSKTFQNQICAFVVICPFVLIYMYDHLNASILNLWTSEEMLPVLISTVVFQY